MVPPSCELTIDRRALPGESAETVEPEIRAILESARVQDQIDSEIIGFTSTAGPSETPADDEIVQASIAACRANGISRPGRSGSSAGAISCTFSGWEFGVSFLDQARWPRRISRMNGCGSMSSLAQA